ncbi:pentapeptide repeat protein [Pacificibacter maritimus]|uniref:Pentapeptide repeat protein n=1 Tax=Pacificibacter maritimus TaxID=762213 RepID=A0A3N4VBL0_9RHOB|nr:pentapeptide repeat-containing protein [Pacificibacter maritimus]RPE71220.1 pentapeptide repeat protein [Pacificibacter maritimus]
MSEKNGFLNWLGLKSIPDWGKSKTLGVFIGFALMCLAFVTLLIGLFAIFGLSKALYLYAAGGDQAKDASEAIRNIGLLVVALVALPFTIYRLKLTTEQNRHNEDVMFNEKLNDANNDLHARYQTSEKQEDRYVDVWKDDIIRRNGAIDRLEALAIERPAMAPRIARMLCVYLREMTRDYPAEKMPQGLEGFELRKWANDLEVKRSDMETAAQVLGRLHEQTKVPATELAIDLTGVNLQAMQLDGLNFEHAKMNNSALDGAKILFANFTRAQLNYATLVNASLHRAKLVEAEMRSATLDGANLMGVSLEAADLGYASFNEKTDLRAVHATGATLRSVNLKDVPNLGDLVTSAFGDATVMLPDDIKPLVKDKWPTSALNYKEYLKEWALFKKDPDAYIPPQLRKE